MRRRPAPTLRSRRVVTLIRGVAFIGTLGPQDECGRWQDDRKHESRDAEHCCGETETPDQEYQNRCDDDAAGAGAIERQADGEAPRRLSNQGATMILIAAPLIAAQPNDITANAA